MKMLSRVAIAVLTLAGTANAQAPTPPPPKADMKAMPPVADKKPDEPVPPPELDAMAKLFTGTWRCKGDEWDDKRVKGPITATSKIKLELDNWWLSETLEVKGRRTLKLVSMTSYDPTSRKWRRIAAMNGGGQLIGTSDGMKEQKMTWNLDLLSPAGAAMFRDYVDATDPKVGIKLSGEISMDRGKSWLSAYVMTCKK